MLVIENIVTMLKLKNKTIYAKNQLTHGRLYNLCIKTVKASFKAFILYTHTTQHNIQLVYKRNGLHYFGRINGWLQDNTILTSEGNIMIYVTRNGIKIDEKVFTIPVDDFPRRKLTYINFLKMIKSMV